MSVHHHTHPWQSSLGSQAATWARVASLSTFQRLPSSEATNILHYTLPTHAQSAEDGIIPAMFRRVSSSREVSENSNGRGIDKRAIGALVVEFALTALGYYILYQSTKGLIGMIDPTKKDKDSVAQVGRRARSKGFKTCPNPNSNSLTAFSANVATPFTHIR